MHMAPVVSWSWSCSMEVNSNRGPWLVLLRAGKLQTPKSKPSIDFTRHGLPGGPFQPLLLSSSFPRYILHEKYFISLCKLKAAGDRSTKDPQQKGRVPHEFLFGHAHYLQSKCEPNVHPDTKVKLLTSKAPKMLTKRISWQLLQVNGASQLIPGKKKVEKS